MRNVWRLLIGAIGTMAVTMGATTAGHATTYYFTESGSANTPALAAPGYGTAVVTTVGSDLEFQITLTSGWFVDTGTHFPVAFGLATGGLDISGSSGSVTALAVPFTQASGSSFTNPGFNAPVNYALECSGGGSGSASCNNVNALTFYVIGAGGLLPLLTSDGVNITADIYNPNSPTTDNTGTIGATAGEVPLPAAVWMFGSVLAGAAGAARYRRRKKAVATVTA